MNLIPLFSYFPSWQGFAVNLAHFYYELSAWQGYGQHANIAEQLGLA